MVDSVILAGIEKTYAMGKVSIHALIEVDLHVTSGETVAVMGPSGCGKTTLLNLIGALDTPTRGTVEVAGSDLATFSDKKLTLFRRHHVGFIFQSFNLIPVVTAQENVELPMLFTKTKKPQRHERSQTLLEAVGLADRADHTPDQLSGGEQQRVAIARALANDPELILADEPTGELDEATGNQVIDALVHLAKEYQKTMILVTHDPQIAQKADRTVYLKQGRITPK